MGYQLRQSTDRTITSGQGPYANPCDACELRDVCVRGCCESHETCVQKTCYRNCDDCGGGPILRYQGGNVPAVCSKAPLKDVHLSQARKASYKFDQRALIKFKGQSIIITQGSPGRVQGSPYPDGCEAIAVNLRHVWSSRGWFSRDMRDYLAMPDGMKLILLTSTHDDVLERAWENEVHNTDFESYGFDYWQCVEFSAYGDMSRYFNLWASYRCLTAHEAAKSHFAVLPALQVLDTSKPKALEPWIQCSEACPQLLQNWQFSSTRNPAQFRSMIAGMKQLLRHMPSIKSLWFVGVVSGSDAYNIVLNFSDYTCYFLAVNPWLAAFKGDGFSLQGKLKKSRLPRRELVIQNQVNYHQLISDAIKAAQQAT